MWLFTVNNSFGKIVRSETKFFETEADATKYAKNQAVFWNADVILSVFHLNEPRLTIKCAEKNW
jgi:hypothetical protein